MKLSFTAFLLFVVTSAFSQLEISTGIAVNKNDAVGFPFHLSYDYHIKGRLYTKSQLGYKHLRVYNDHVGATLDVSSWEIHQTLSYEIIKKRKFVLKPNLGVNYRFYHWKGEMRPPYNTLPQRAWVIGTRTRNFILNSYDDGYFKEHDVNNPGFSIQLQSQFRLTESRLLQHPCINYFHFLKPLLNRSGFFYSFFPAGIFFANRCMGASGIGNWTFTKPNCYFLNMEKRLRKTGLDVFEHIPWGTHFSAFYETKADILDLLVPYFKTGLENNEYCLWIGSNPFNIQRVILALRQSMPGFDHILKKKSFEIIPVTEWYSEQGEFDLKKIVNKWQCKVKEATDKGYDGLRVHDYKGWLDQEDWDRFVKYEEEFTVSTKNLPLIVLCTYPLNKTDASTLLSVMHLHKRIISRWEGQWRVLEDAEIKLMKEDLLNRNNQLLRKVKERTAELNQTIGKLANEIAEREKAETVINNEKKLSNEIIDSIPGLFALFDENLRFVRWNKNFEMVSGYTAEEIQELHGIESFYDNEEDKKRTSRILTEIFVKGSGNAEVSPLMKGGKPVDIFFIGRSFKYEGKTYLITTGIDITDRKNAQKAMEESLQQIKSLTQHLQNIREEERTHIAREIHDELGQQLTVLKMDIAWLNTKLENEKELVKEKLNDILILIDNTVTSVRRIASELRPTMLDDIGIAAAMEWHLHEFGKHTGIKTYFIEQEIELELPPETSINLFRIFQESMTNIARHSGATEVKVNMRYEDGKIELTIEDNGRGFDKGQALEKKTLGILGMKERTAMMEGTYEIQSHPGKGATVRVVVPLQAENKKP
jgi:PAS domain S-box-containing protein